MFRIQILLFCLFAFSASPVLADLAGDYNGTGNEYTMAGIGSDGVVGWAFTPNVDILVTGIGVYDREGDGLDGAHDIGIFRASDGANLVTGNVSSGVANAIIANTVGGTRMDNASLSLKLNQGVAYYIVGGFDATNQDILAWGTGAVSFDSDLTWNGFIENFGTNDIFDPVFIGSGQPGDFGPNFTFTRAVPEPSSAVLIVGLASMSFFRRRRIL